MTNMLDKGYGISILIPYRDDGSGRREIFEWLERFYTWRLPEAQFIIGEDRRGTPFSKTAAVNDAARHCGGDIFVILDADAWIDPKVILEAAHRIRRARANHKRRWYVPYRELWRLTRESSEELLEENPFWVPSPGEWTEGRGESCLDNQDESGIGHHFGALIQIMPREAFWEVGGMDELFRGWGAEDVSFMLALDTLYTRHRTLDNPVFTFYHKPRGRRHHRMWAGQDREDPNGRRGERYHRAHGDPGVMRRLVDEGLEFVRGLEENL